MKWQIAPEFRAEYYKKQAKRSGGSAPSSPASSKEVQPNFRGPNGQNLGYDTSMVSSFSAKDAHQSNRAGWQINSAQPGYPPPYQLAPPGHPQEASTPMRHRADTSTTQPDVFNEDSPMQHRPNGGQPVYTLPSAHHDPRSPPNLNPTLSSSYMDTPFHPSQSSLVTPAPLRQNPRLAPPSTLVAPSKFMPESSPAGPGLFWKGIMGVTPGQPVQDVSPVKIEPVDRINGANIDRTVMSSSPPMMMDGSGSPSKPGRSSQQVPPTSSFQNDSSTDAPRDRDGDLQMRSRSASMNANAATNQTSAGRASLGPPANFSLNPNANAKVQNEDEDDGEGGFDLAKGFAPIASGMRSGSASVVGR